MSLVLVLLSLLTIIVLVYWLIKKRHDYWMDRGIPSIKPIFPVGTMSGVGSSIFVGEKMAEHYRALKGKGVIGGLHFFITPVALILDLDLLRNVFVKDFHYFQSRGMYVNEKGDPLSAQLSFVEGEKWRTLRTKLTPTFTTGRMRMMHPTLMLVADQFKEHLRELIKEQKDVEMKELFAQFSTDIIGNMFFGLECNSMKDSESEFRRYGRKNFQPTRMDYLIIRLCMTFPKVAKFLNLRVINAEVSEFFMESIRKTVEYREQNNVQRNDFLQLLMQIKNEGKLEGESEELGRLTFNELAAQTFAFFLAGFETSSTTMTFAAYELALNQDIQDKAREEIREVLERHNGEMRYEAAMELKYLDQIIKETLRKYPIATILRRKVHEAYTVPGTSIVLPKEMIVFVPVLGIHRDPEYYPDPEQFDPDRFSKENISNRHLFAWLPFGEGPRNCIGLRFGMMQTRIGLATLLNTHRILPSQKTPSPLKFHTNGNVLSPAGGMYLRIEEI